MHFRFHTDRLNVTLISIVIFLAFVALVPARIADIFEITLFSYEVSLLSCAVILFGLYSFLVRPRKHAIWIFIFYITGLSFLLVSIIYHGQFERQVGASIAYMMPISAMLLGTSIKGVFADTVFKWALIVAIVSILLGVLVIILTVMFPLFRPEELGLHRGHWRLRTPFGSPIASGGVLLICVIFFANSLLSGFSTWRVVVLTLLIFAMALTGSRAVFFAAAAGLMMMVSVNGLRNVSIPKRLPVFAVLAILLVILGIAYAPSGDRIVRGYGAGEGDVWRAQSIPTGLNAWSKDPILGRGGGMIYPVGEPELDMPEGPHGAWLMTIEGETSLHEPHNLYVLVLVEFGLIGSIIYLTPLLIAVALLIGSSNQLSRVGGVAIAAFLLFQLFGSHLYVNFRVSIWVGIVAGTMLAMDTRYRYAKHRSNRIRAIG